MIPDTFNNSSGVEFGELKSLVCDDLGNMIVIDSITDSIKVIDIHGTLLGSLQVRSKLCTLLVFYKHVEPQVDHHPPGHPSSICVDEGRRELYVSYSEANAVVKYQL